MRTPRLAPVVVLSIGLALVSAGCPQEKAAKQVVPAINAAVGLQVDTALRSMATDNFADVATQVDPSAAGRLNEATLKAQWDAVAAPMGAYLGSGTPVGTTNAGVTTYTVPVRFSGGVKTATFVYNAQHSLIDFRIG